MRNTGGQAFPGAQFKKCKCGLHLEVTGHGVGMTLRDYFAGQALIGLTKYHGDNENSDSAIASYSYDIANAMIAERNK